MRSTPLTRAPSTQRTQALQDGAPPAAQREAQPPTPAANAPASASTQAGARARARAREAQQATKIAGTMEAGGAGNLTADQLRQIVPGLSAAKAAALVPHLNTAMHEANINTPARKAAFIAQLAHESGGFRYDQEIASGAAYEGRTDLGNTQPGDGKRFKGRGYIQLTGRANYTQAGKDLGLDLVKNPALAAKPENAARVAAWFWNKSGLNALADQGNFDGITRRINGGYNGKADRDAYHHVAKDVLAQSHGRPGKGSATAATGAAEQTPPTFDDVEYMRAPFAEGATLTVGSTDSAVQEVQQRLRALGYDAPSTGVYDAATKAAVDAYQKDNKLTPPPGMEGVVGATTLNFLRHATETPSLDAIRNGATLQLGAMGDSVLALQKLLGFGEGGQTGILGPTTLRALADFQAQNGLDQRGTLEANTLAALEANQLAKTGQSTAPSTAGPTGSVQGVSEKGQKQMNDILAHARSQSANKRPDGWCYAHVKDFIAATGYGKLTNVFSQLPADKQGLARNFADHMNVPTNAAKAGLQRLDNALNPPIQSPYDPRIPPGAIVVVPPGVPGTRHPTAGDIVIADGKGRFFNGGEMGYGGAAGFPTGKLLGVYIPE